MIIYNIDNKEALINAINSVDNTFVIKDVNMLKSYEFEVTKLSSFTGDTLYSCLGKLSDNVVVCFNIKNQLVIKKEFYKVKYVPSYIERHHRDNDLPQNISYNIHGQKTFEEWVIEGNSKRNNPIEPIVIIYNRDSDSFSLDWRNGDWTHKCTFSRRPEVLISLVDLKICNRKIISATYFINNQKRINFEELKEIIFLENNFDCINDYYYLNESLTDSQHNLLEIIIF